MPIRRPTTGYTPVRSVRARWLTASLWPPVRRTRAAAEAAHAHHAPRPDAPPARATTLDFRPDVEGLRGVAILLVVGYHAGLSAVSGGFVGVDVFFVLSGYLITRLLVAEQRASGSISLTAFYARRVRRLLPASLVVLCATLGAAAAIYVPTQVGDVATGARAATAFLSNVLLLARTTDYFAAGTETNPLLHTWSLSVEEQFYLVWPLVVLLGLRVLGRRRFVGLLLALAVPSLAGAWWYTFALRPVAFYSMPTRGWEFAVGAGVAFLPRSLVGGGRGAWPGRLARNVAGWGGLALVLYAGVTFTAELAYPGLNAAVPVLGTALMLAVGGSAEPFSIGRGLATRLLQWIGRHSYGWYLWHWPVIVLGAELLPDRGPALNVTLVLGALALAVVTRVFVERPCQRALAGSRPTLTLAVGVAASIVLVAGTLVVEAYARHEANTPSQLAFTRAIRDRARLYRDGCNQSIDDTTAYVCAYGAAHAARTVALFGDSHAAQWMPALGALAEARGWRLLVVTKSACPAAEVTPYERVLQRRFTECAAWRRAALDTLAALCPTLVLLSSSTEYVFGGPRPEPRASVSATEWEDGWSRTLDRLSDLGMQAVVVQDTPQAPEDVPHCLMRAAWRGRPLRVCDFVATAGRHVAAAHAVERAVARTTRAAPRARSVDLTAALCTGGRCVAAGEAVVSYRDARHLTATRSATLAGAIGASLDSVADARR